MAGGTHENMGRSRRACLEVGTNSSGKDDQGIGGGGTEPKDGSRAKKERP